MKNWKTTILGILAAALILAVSKGWIDNDISAFIGATIVALFGVASKDHDVSGIVGDHPPKDGGR
jgi:hypothetical protein